MQETNDPRNFQYDTRQPIGGIFPPAQLVEDPDDSNPGFNFMDSPAKNVSHIRRDLGISPSKTGGQIELQGLVKEDVVHEVFLSREAGVDGAKKFDSKNIDKVNRYVESLVTGNFMRVQKEINL